MQEAEIGANRHTLDHTRQDGVHPVDEGRHRASSLQVEGKHDILTLPDGLPDVACSSDQLSTARRNYAASSAGCGAPNFASSFVFVYVHSIGSPTVSGRFLAPHAVVGLNPPTRIPSSTIILRGW